MGLGFSDKIAFETKRDILNSHPVEVWLKIIWQWSVTREINFAVFKALINYLTAKGILND